MYHFLYETTNIRNNKTYVGVRSSKVDPRVHFDGYLGSGFALKRSIKKHGKDSFTRKVLVLCDSKEYAFYLESLFVNEDFVATQNTYNMTTGGKGGYIGKEVYNSKAFRKAASLGAKEQHLAFIAKFGQDAMGSRMSSVALCNTPESREMGAAKYKALYKDPEFVAKKKESAVKGWQKEGSEQRRLEVSEQSKNYWANMSEEEMAAVSEARSKRTKGMMTVFDIKAKENKRVTAEEYHANPDLVNCMSRIAIDFRNSLQV